MEMPQIFENKEFGKVRVTEYNGAPWFVASDVAKADARRDNLTASGVITSRKNGLRILQ